MDEATPTKKLKPKEPDIKQIKCQFKNIINNIMEIDSYKSYASQSVVIPQTMISPSKTSDKKIFLNEKLDTRLNPSQSKNINNYIKGAFTKGLMCSVTQDDNIDSEGISTNSISNLDIKIIDDIKKIDKNFSKDSQPKSNFENFKKKRSAKRILDTKLQNKIAFINLKLK